ncbi:putative E3 ubiquitin-protein ligase UBR7 [Phycodurus eques]|uniref:putative E3 ubiquitin-protein ligase UBR7 n=1 Tax=Phycodurus eques TaxID=693459 RepID=UPI002ACD8FB1|nr:putative E3 ubiquitin-protein ligase UBR7 [Phycodurus eques]
MAETKTAESNLDDLLANEEDLENALCVLAGSDPENCSYSRGYVKRQAVFACNTCTPNAAQPAGICLACANKCHDGHDIFELYTKRNFRCDCGNGKFGDFRCQLIPAKDEENVKNLYNHNFSGCYCSCDRPYPDMEDQVNDEMIQCVVCEDWFHTRHLRCTVAEPEELQEMLCEACMNKAPFLWTYAAHFAVSPEEDEEVDVVEVEEKRHVSGSSKISLEEPSTSLEYKDQEGAATRSLPCKRSHDDMTDRPGETKTASCKLKDLQAQNVARPRRGAVFWPSGWRSRLCTCTSCKRAYVAAQVHFLMDESDSVLAYENRGLVEPFGQHPLMAVTSSMNRVQQLEFIYGYNELTTALTTFFHQCAAENKVITAEAVHQFFEELQAKKRRRTNMGYQ